MFVGLVISLSVKSPKTPCPRCNSQQSFRPQTQSVDQQYGIIQVYIRCTMCNWRHDLRLSTRLVERMMLNETRLLQQGRVEEERYGVVKSTTTRMLRVVREEMAQSRKEAGLV